MAPILAVIIPPVAVVQPSPILPVQDISVLLAQTGLNEESEASSEPLTPLHISNDAESLSPSPGGVSLRDSPLASVASSTTLIDDTVSVSTTMPSSPRPAARKALLIGICYTRDGESRQLIGPHRDVGDMKAILIERYGYEEDNIVVMIDRTGYLEHDPEREQRNQPTRENILRELENLVKDAQEGDHFLFHYAGHSFQKPTGSVGKGDGLDELILTSDNGHVTDDELRKLLVDTPPAGSSLTAILDTCNSATLLNLDHYRCNRVYTPWTNGCSDSRESLRINESRPASQAPKTKGGLTRMPISSTISIRTRTSSVSSFQPAFSDPMMPRSESPLQTPHCNGNCRELPDCLSPMDDPNRPHVVSISACKNSQICWEGPTDSMTQALVKILRNDPHPPLNVFLCNISHELHQTSRKVHALFRENRQYLEEALARGEMAPEAYSTYNMDQFQDPQIASHKPLDMAAPFTLGSPLDLQKSLG